jgi:hypothetical protein
MPVPVVARGFGLTGGWGSEVTWGTEVARTNWLPLNNCNVKRVRTKQIIPHLGYLGQASSNPREFYNDEDRVEGSFEFNAAFDDSTLFLLRHLFGTVSSGAGPPYTHTFTLASPQPEGLTMEVIPGTSPGFNNSQQFVGCLLSRGTITVRPGSPVVVACDVMGKTSGGLEAAGTPTYNTTRQHILQNLAGNITLGGTAVACKQMVIRIDRGLEPLRELSSLNPSRPVESRLDLSIELLLAWQAAKFHTNFFADTIEDLAVTFTGTSSRAAALTAHNCLVMDTSEGVSSPGQIEQRVTLKPFADSGGDQGLALAITNANAAATTN